MSGSKLAMENRVPKVSVIVPVYNTEKYLEQAVLSLMNQSLTDIEIILINDGSTDNSLEVLSRLAINDERIRVLTQENGGPSKARNHGVTISRGRYLYFMDSDDYISSDTLEECFKKSEDLKLDFLFFDAEQFAENKSLTPGVDYDRKGMIDEKVYNGAEILAYLLEKKLYRVSPCLIFINRDYYINSKLEFFEGIIHEDELFSPRLYLNARRVGRIDKAFYKRRFREDSIMSSAFAMKNIKAYFTVLRELKKIRQTLDQTRQAILDKLMSDMINAAVYKSHKLVPAEKLIVFWTSMTESIKYIQLKTLVVLLFKS